MTVVWTDLNKSEDTFLASNFHLNKSFQKSYSCCIKVLFHKELYFVLLVYFIVCTLLYIMLASSALNFSNLAKRFVKQDLYIFDRDWL